MAFVQSVTLRCKKKLFGMDTGVDAHKCLPDNTILFSLTVFLGMTNTLLANTPSLSSSNTKMLRSKKFNAGVPEPQTPVSIS